LLLRQFPDFAMQSHIFHPGLAGPVRHERRNRSIVRQQAAIKCSCQNEQRMNFSEIRSKPIFEYSHSLLKQKKPIFEYSHSLLKQKIIQDIRTVKKKKDRN
jgi:hypothetical protein